MLAISAVKDPTSGLSPASRGPDSIANRVQSGSSRIFIGVRQVLYRAVERSGGGSICNADSQLARVFILLL